jgi:hypothetical protein
MEHSLLGCGEIEVILVYIVVVVWNHSAGEVDETPRAHGLMLALNRLKTM